jgi:phenylalanine-4-hydroxylase
MFNVQVQDITALDLDHPGANDPIYRERRNFIASLYDSFVQTGIIQDVSYTTEENQTWLKAMTILDELHSSYACSRFLVAKEKLPISKTHIPSFNLVNKLLAEQTDFRIMPIAGLIDGATFMTLLASKTMPCTQYIRHHSNPEYTPEPDIIHEIVGHAYFFTDPDIVDITVLFGQIAKQLITNNDELGLQLLGKIYWFTIEFGLIQDGDQVKAFGAGLLSSIGEMKNAVTGNVQRLPFDLEAIKAINYDFSHLQQTYFILPSLDFLHNLLVEEFDFRV